MIMKVNVRKLWKYVIFAYIICCTAFTVGKLSILNSVSLYLFLGVSVVNIILHIKKIKINACIICLAAFLVILYFGSLYSPASSEIINRTVYDYFTMVIIAFCFVQYVKDMDDVKWIFFAFMTGVIVLCVYSYISYGSNFWSALKNNSVAASNNITRLGAVDGEVGNTNTFGMKNSIAFVIALFYAFFKKHKYRSSKYIYLLCALLFFVMGCASASKKALLLLVMGPMIMFYISVKDKGTGKKLKYVLILGIAMVCGLYAVFTLPVFSGIASRFDTFLSFMKGTSAGGISENERMSFLTLGIVYWLKHAVFGNGTASSFYFFGVYSHNNFIELLMNNGITGFLVFYYPFAFAFVRFFKRSRRWLKCNETLSLLYTVELLILISGMFSVFYYERYIMILFVAIYSSIRMFEGLDKEMVDIEKERMIQRMAE